MPSFWQKIWLWIRSALLLIVMGHVILFLILNMDSVVSPDLSLIYTSYKEPGLLLVLISTAVISIFGWWLVWTIVRTVRQLREVSERSNQAKQERKNADMQAKAAMLHTRSSEPPAGPGAAV
jgi:ABC-type nickel/cobalt efflux system permease component RcnA